MGCLYKVRNNNSGEFRRNNLRSAGGWRGEYYKIGYILLYVIKVLNEYSVGLEWGHVTPHELKFTSTEVFNVNLMIYWSKIDKKPYNLEAMILSGQCVVNI